jgi:hypothetical protein
MLHCSKSYYDSRGGVDGDTYIQIEEFNGEWFEHSSAVQPMWWNYDDAEHTTLSSSCEKSVIKL